MQAGSSRVPSGHAFRRKAGWLKRWFSGNPYPDREALFPGCLPGQPGGPEVRRSEKRNPGLGGCGRRVERVALPGFGGQGAGIWSVREAVLKIAGKNVT